MYAFIATAAALATAVTATSVGSAVVVNKCTYDVTLANVPASGGGYDEIDKTLQPDDTYTQQWTELSNTMGWSIKLSKDTTLDNILQYEYTFHNDGTIWYDLSEVNGNPWDGNWEITADSPTGACSPKQQAYRYATDDAYGMQSCTQDSTITVTLCSGESQDDGGAASASSSVAAETSSQVSATSVAESSAETSVAPETTTAAPATSTAAPETSSAAPETTSEAPASSTAAASSRTWTHHTWNNKQLATSATPTTFATLTTSTASVVTAQGNGVTVTEVDTAVVTQIVTATAYGRHRRHNHAHHA